VYTQTHKCPNTHENGEKATGIEDDGASPWPPHLLVRSVKLCSALLYSRYRPDCFCIVCHLPIGQNLYKLLVCLALAPLAVLLKRTPGQDKAQSQRLVSIGACQHANMAVLHDDAGQEKLARFAQRGWSNRAAHLGGFNSGGKMPASGDEEQTRRRRGMKSRQGVAVPSIGVRQD